MLDESLLAEPSTPRPTFTPAAMYFLMGAMPEPSRMLEQGQCAAPQPALANFRISSSSTWIACANQTSSPSQPSVSIQSTGRIEKRSSV